MAGLQGLVFGLLVEITSLLVGTFATVLECAGMTEVSCASKIETIFSLSILNSHFH